MKRFIVSTLVVSLAFIGAGAVVDKIVAGSKSDEKALSIIAKARTAIGGEAKAAAVRSFIIKGQTSKTFSINGVDKFEQGETEIVFEAPNRLMKMVKMGDHSAAAGEAIADKVVDVVVVGGDDEGPHKVRVNAGDGEFTSEDGKKIIIRKSDNVEWTGKEGEAKVFVRKSGDGGEWTSKEGDQVIVRKRADGGEWTSKDGETKDVTTADGRKFTIVTRGGDGNATFTTKDGNHIMLREKIDGPQGAPRDNELLRTTLSLLLTAPDGMDVSYKYAGETNLDGTLADTVVASFAGSSFKLYFDRSTSLPLGVSYLGHGPVMVRMRKADGGSAAVEKDVVTFERKLDKSDAGVETLVRFADFRSVDGLMLPYKWTTTIGGKQGEVFDVSSYELNPANISERFKNAGGHKVMVRSKKPAEK